MTFLPQAPANRGYFALRTQGRARGRVSTCDLRHSLSCNRQWFSPRAGRRAYQLLREIQLGARGSALGHWRLPFTRSIRQRLSPDEDLLALLPQHAHHGHPRTEDALLVVMEVPGVDRDIKVEDDTLSVEARIDYSKYEAWSASTPSTMSAMSPGALRYQT